MLRIRNSGSSSRAGSQPIPAFWLKPKRLPEGSVSSISAVSGSAPSGPAACVATRSNPASSVSNTDATEIAAMTCPLFRLSQYMSVRAPIVYVHPARVQYSVCPQSLRAVGREKSMHPLYRKISRRLVPFLILLYLVAFLDRVNIGFAALTMNRDLHIGAGLFGLAAGMFFLGYFLFEVPSNLILLRVGARRWIMLLMIAWGMVSVATAFVPGFKLYIVLRFLLGLAEAGFYPGVILYLTFWLPPRVRSSVMAIFVTAIPLSNLIGAPVSAQILQLDSVLGLKGWQWLFLLEGSPAILLGAMVYLPIARQARPRPLAHG